MPVAPVFVLDLDRGCIAQPRQEGSVDVVLALLAAKGSCGGGISLILWIIAAVLVIAGIVTLIRGGVLAGIALIVVGLLIGPGGVSIFC
jgi:hypothetical protein